LKGRNRKKVTIQNYGELRRKCHKKKIEKRNMKKKTMIEDTKRKLDEAD
jgi:hypothetical protein